jgi:S-adenosylmethionine:tRNA-ribosyltransferase-isomerase (queuine synthetase)
MSTRLSDYDYDLPRELIAQHPAERRDDSRMMVLHRDAQIVEHRQFRDLKTFLQDGDLLVLNDTQVLPARRVSSDLVLADGNVSSSRDAKCESARRQKSTTSLCASRKSPPKASASWR